MWGSVGRVDRGKTVVEMYQNLFLINKKFMSQSESGCDSQALGSALGQGWWVTVGDNCYTEGRDSCVLLYSWEITDKTLQISKSFKERL